MQRLVQTVINWLNAEPTENAICLQRDGAYAFLGYADLTRPVAPLITFRSMAWLIMLAVGLPVVFLA